MSEDIPTLLVELSEDISTSPAFDMGCGSMICKISNLRLYCPHA